MGEVYLNRRYSKGHEIGTKEDYWFVVLLGVQGHGVGLHTSGTTSTRITN